tara:strand:- start:5138 stop:5695 length:558 start_codon:yes stop_codon:yes gene_type:complete
LNKDNLKLIEDDIPIFFASNDASLDRFQDFLSKKSFRSTFIVFNSSKEDLSKENTKILSFQIPFNLNQLSQALQNILIQKEDIEYHDIKFKKLFLNMTGKTIGDSKSNTKLTDKESKILWHLVKEKGLSVSQSFLLNKVWGYKDDIETKTLTTHIYTIRKKLNNFNNTFSIENSEDGYCVKFKSN